jgi:hypothetical protein
MPFWCDIFPDETLSLKLGDCEDRAFLLASLMIASGISSYNIRVALGKVKISAKIEYDHMWVMYKNEDGYWMLIEPLVVRTGATQSYPVGHRARQHSKVIAEYIPSYVFNDNHLWIIKHGDSQPSFQESLDKNWKKFNPKFAGEVHQTILHRALKGADDRVLQLLDGYFSKAVLKTFGPIIDDIDRRTYNPLDHFDNGYIDEGWKQVSDKLSEFKADNTKNIDSFAMAAHAIADFYAHSSYLHFARINGDGEAGYAECFDHEDQNAGLENPPNYSTGSTFDLTGEQFSINETYWKDQNKNDIASTWAGLIISGRYAQNNDSQGELIGYLIEAHNKIPANLLGESDFYLRGSLPHHNEIAVDDEKLNPDKHRLYSLDAQESRMNFKNQFHWRENTAVLHIRKAFFDNWTGSVLSWNMPPTLQDTE